MDLVSQFKQNSLQIRIADMATAVAVSQQIPELHKPYPLEEYQRRLSVVPHLILVAYDAADQVAGFKVGYERDGYFYSWMGGVLPAFRRQGVALTLAEAQENWAREQGYTSVTFKTRNRLKGMLCFALQRGFDLLEVEPRETIGEYRIWLRKTL